MTNDENRPVSNGVRENARLSAGFSGRVSRIPAHVAVIFHKACEMFYTMGQGRDLYEDESLFRSQFYDDVTSQQVRAGGGIVALNATFDHAATGKIIHGFRAWRREKIAGRDINPFQ